MHAPITIVELVDLGHCAHLVLSTLVDCRITDSVIVATLPTMGDAAALAFAEYGFQRPCVDGNDAWDGYWIG
jgi:hypothetical protein